MELKLNQPSRFYIYNLYIPLILPIFLTALYAAKSTSTDLIICGTISQIFIFNVIVLCSSIGVLPEEMGEDKIINKGWSLIILMLSLGLYAYIYQYLLGKQPGSWGEIFTYMAVAIALLYGSLKLISENPETPHTRGVTELAKDRAEKSSGLISKFKGKTK